MSEGHSDWEKVEAPIVSPPKARVKDGVKGKDEKEGGLKGKVGEVKRVLKSGMFGESPIDPCHHYTDKMLSLPVKMS